MVKFRLNEGHDMHVAIRLIYQPLEVVMDVGVPWRGKGEVVMELDAGEDTSLLVFGGRWEKLYLAVPIMNLGEMLEV